MAKSMEMTLKQFSKLSADKQTEVLKERQRLLRLCIELDEDMDGVKCPRSAAAVLNAIRMIVAEYH